MPLQVRAKAAGWVAAGELDQHPGPRPRKHPHTNPAPSLAHRSFSSVLESMTRSDPSVPPLEVSSLSTSVVLPWSTCAVGGEECTPGHPSALQKKRLAAGRATSTGHDPQTPCSLSTAGQQASPSSLRQVSTKRAPGSPATAAGQPQSRTYDRERPNEAGISHRGRRMVPPHMHKNAGRPGQPRQALQPSPCALQAGDLNGRRRAGAPQRPAHSHRPTSLFTAHYLYNKM